MPHIHTDPGQHDITTSAWIVRFENNVPKVLVHMHRKHNKLMQVGGHIEIDETPWQTLDHELLEESGYSLSELKVLQPTENIPVVDMAIVHPVPVISNTHKISESHYHSDYGYAFVADSLPKNLPAEGESQDIRWLTIEELEDAQSQHMAWKDAVDIYRTIVERYF